MCCDYLCVCVAPISRVGLGMILNSRALSVVYMAAILFIQFRTVVVQVISQTRISEWLIIIILIRLLKAYDNCAPMLVWPHGSV